MLPFIKNFHVTFAYLTAAFFIVRGLLMLVDSPSRHRKWMRIAPHVIDTLLLASGLWLAVNMYSVFYHQPWLLAKLAGIVAYIILGTIALKRGRTKGIRFLALLGALAVLAYIFAVALHKSPVPFS